MLIKLNEPGILFSENSKRYYPYGNLLTQVLGYTTIDNIGQSGIELYANKYLAGVKGYATEQSDVHGIKIDNTLSNYIPSINGLNVNLTIDVNIQKFLENALNKLVEDHYPKSATAIVMNPKTGEILAMGSKPSFDLNTIPRDDIGYLLGASKNLSIVDVYEPGSTFKVLTMATALEEKVTSEGERFYDPGFRIVDGEKIKCWKSHGHGSQTLTEGLCNSCNSVFVDLALRLGKEKMLFIPNPSRSTWLDLNSFSLKIERIFFPNGILCLNWTDQDPSFFLTNLISPVFLSSKKRSSLLNQFPSNN